MYIFILLTYNRNSYILSYQIIENLLSNLREFQALQDLSSNKTKLLAQILGLTAITNSSNSSNNIQIFSQQRNDMNISITSNKEISISKVESNEWIVSEQDHHRIHTPSDAEMKVRGMSGVTSRFMECMRDKYNSSQLHAILNAVGKLRL